MSDNGDTPSPVSPAAPPSSIAPPAAPATETTQSPKKRTQANGEGKVTKRRAARACASCRARKVRCDVVEGIPCNNCRWDSVECIVQESRRRKKHLPYSCGPATVGARAGNAEALRTKSIGAAPPINITANLAKPAFAPNGTFTLPLNGDQAAAAARLSYQAVGGFPAVVGDATAPVLPGFVPLSPGIPAGVPLLHPLLKTSIGQPGEWPAFIKPIPDRIALEDRTYLVQKQVLTLPHLQLQNALLKAYVEYVHPYMPLMELHDFLRVVNDRTGAAGKVSLFLYHAVMFAATAFVDEALLKEAGYQSRRDARRAFFSRTRLLYDFDYETDRLILVQGLLLMTYWYETPDDSKDTWHWMGIAISLAHTIGLHRNPAKTPMTPRKQKLWKRVWWSCFMRDRLVALGMRRPTRIKAGDFDVPPLVEDDFEIEALPEDNQVLGPECALIRDVEMQRELAIMCIEKAKLCGLIGDVLQVQYCVLSRAGMRPEHTTNSTHMLLPNKNPDNMEEVEQVDRNLREWFQDPPECCRYRPLGTEPIPEATKPIAVQRNLLHMVYHTTISALHRPLFLPASPGQAPSPPVEVQETARQRVREAAEHITRMVAEMRRHGLERYLPTTGVTVILPATIIHMLDMKNLNPEARAKAAQGLKECLTVMSNLRNIYAAADFATGFLDAALRSFLGTNPAAASSSSSSSSSSSAQPHPQQQQNPHLPPQQQQQQPAPHPSRGAGKLLLLNRALAPAPVLSPQNHLHRPSTPPPEDASSSSAAFLNPSDVSLFPNANPDTDTNADPNQPFVSAAAAAADPLRDADGDLVMQHPHPTAVAVVAGDTPPHTDHEDAATPPVVGDAGEQMGDFVGAGAGAVGNNSNGSGGVGGMGIGGGGGGGGGSSGGFDFDQWLQFPAEGGLSTSDDAFVGGMFGGADQTAMELGNDAGLDWMASMSEGLGR